MRLTITFTIRNFYPNKGGGISYTLGLARALSRINCTTIVITSKKGSQKEEEVIDNVKVYRIGYKNIYGMEILNFIELVKLIKRINPDILHTNDPSPVGDETYAAARLLLKPIVTTYHADVGFKKISRLYLRFKIKLLKHYDLVIVTTRLYRQLLSRRGVPDDKLAVVPVGINWERFAEVNISKVHNLRRDLKIENRRIILFVGGLNRGQIYKRLDLLLLALKFLKKYDIALIVIGRGDLLNTYRKIARRLGIIDNVIFLDNVSDEELPLYYHLADIFVLPSPTLLEGFGIVLLEAMASGCPVITSTRAGGGLAVVESGAGYLYEAYNVKDLISKIELLINSKQRKKKVLNGIRYSRKYDWDNIAKTMLRMYENVIKSKKIE